MSQITPYTLHKRAEQEHRQQTKERQAKTLPRLRALQQREAESALTGKTVSITQRGETLGKLSHCEVGDSTATVCFTLIERGRGGAIMKKIGVTPKMELFMEHAHV